MCYENGLFVKGKLNLFLTACNLTVGLGRVVLLGCAAGIRSILRSLYSGIQMCTPSSLLTSYKQDLLIPIVGLSLS